MLTVIVLEYIGLLVIVRTELAVSRGIDQEVRVFPFFVLASVLSATGAILGETINLGPGELSRIAGIFQRRTTIGKMYCYEASGPWLLNVANSFAINWKTDAITRGLLFAEARILYKE